MRNKMRNLVDLDSHKSIQKSKKNVNRMVLINSIIYIVSHMPEFLVTLILIVNAKKISEFSKYRFSTDLLNEEAAFFSLVSITGQLYIFLIFDKNFKESFKDLANRLMLSFTHSRSSQERRITNERPLELINLRNLIGNGLID